MGCCNPINIGRNREVKRFSRFPERFGYRDFLVPCGQCRFCRMVFSSRWAARLYLENLMHKRSAWLTLTYAPAHLPEGGTLVKKHLQDFMKRLRSNLEYEYGVTGIRFFASGEYGDELGRPHYHVMIFGWDFPDQYFWKTSPAGQPVYRSPFLEKCWTLGISSVGDVAYESAQYVARYHLKKQNGAAADKHYGGRLPEFSLQSRKPGIGESWYQANKSWLWRENEIRIDGRSYRPFRYFRELFKREDPEGFEAWKLSVSVVESELDDDGED